MTEFVDEKIDVETAEEFPRPVRFTWRDQVHEVVEITREWVDTGWGQLPPRSRKWFTRRHRRYFVVNDPVGDTFEMYNDYSDRRNKTWWLVSKADRGEEINT